MAILKKSTLARQSKKLFLCMSLKHYNKVSNCSVTGSFPRFEPGIFHSTQSLGLSHRHRIVTSDGAHRDRQRRCEYRCDDNRHGRCGRIPK